jgi:hypothetical protein
MYANFSELKLSGRLLLKQTLVLHLQYTWQTACMFSLDWQYSTCVYVVLTAGQKS